MPVRKTNTARLHLHGVSKVVKLTETAEWCCQGLRGGRSGELLFNRYTVSFLKNEKFLDIHCTV